MEKTLKTLRTIVLTALTGTRVTSSSPVITSGSSPPSSAAARPSPVSSAVNPGTGSRGNRKVRSGVSGFKRQNSELHRILRFFGIREQLGPNSTIRSSVFGNFSLAKIFGLRSSKTFHYRRSSVFGIRIFFINEDLRSSVFVNCWNQIVQIYSYLIYK